jgi:hypothetical protein
LVVSFIRLIFVIEIKNIDIMKIELIETINTFRVNVPNLSTERYLAMCQMVNKTKLNETTVCGEEDGYLVFETPENKEYVNRILTELISVVKQPIIKLNNSTLYGDLKVGDKFLIDYTVYTKTDVFEYEKIKSIGHEGGRIYLRDSALIHAVETDANFIYHEK